jgi:hypothetical protein
VDPLDVALRRAHALLLEDPSDEVDPEVAKVVPQLVRAGYVEEQDWDPGCSLWGFTAAGLRRAEELGCD